MNQILPSDLNAGQGGYMPPINPQEQALLNEQYKNLGGQDRAPARYHRFKIDKKRY
jgi:hypothetical protein